MPTLIDDFFSRFSIHQFPDHSAKWLLELGENVRGLLLITADELVEALDWEQLTPVPTSFIPDNLREQESDVIYHVPFRDPDRGEVWIYILIEHQSSVDVTMGFRVLFYMLQIWDRQRRHWEDQKTPKRQWRFAPIIPIVFYTGEERWDVPMSLEALMEVPEALKRFIPRFDTLFLGVKAEETARLTQTNHPFGWLMSVLQKEGGTKEEMVSALKAAAEQIDALPESESHVWQRAIYYLYLLILHRRPAEEHNELKEIVSKQIQHPQRVTEGEEMAQTMAEYLMSEGKKQGLTEGEKRGEARGEARGQLRAKREAVLKILRLRFDIVPTSLERKIKSIRRLDRLDNLLDQAVTADSISEIGTD